MPLIPLFVQNEIQAAAVNRMSAFNFCDPFDHILPIADNTVGKTDRAHLWGMYSGIAVATIVLGPYCVEAGEVFLAGAVAGGIFIAGAIVGEVFVAGAEAGQGGCD